MKYFISLFVSLPLLLLLTACNKGEMPLEREEEYSPDTSGQETPVDKDKKEELPLRKGIFDEKQEKSLELE